MLGRRLRLHNRESVGDAMHIMQNEKPKSDWSAVPKSD